jgi:hypothetical protein
VSGSLELLKIGITYPIRAIAECTRHMHQTIRWERNRVSEIETRLLIKAGSLNYGKHRNCEMINYQGMSGMPVSVHMDTDGSSSSPGDFQFHHAFFPTA